MIDWVWLVSIKFIEVTVAFNEAHKMQVDIVRQVGCGGLTGRSMVLMDTGQGGIFLQGRGALSGRQVNSLLQKVLDDTALLYQCGQNCFLVSQL